MDGKLKIIIIGLVIVLVAFVGIIAMGSHDQKSAYDPCINKVSYLDGSMGYDYPSKCATLTVEFGYDMDKLNHQNIKLTGGPSVHILHGDEYIGKVDAELRSITPAIGKIGWSYSIFYDLTSLGIQESSPGWFVYNGQYIPIKDIIMDAEATIPQSWEKWMVDGYFIETRY